MYTVLVLTLSYLSVMREEDLLGDLFVVEHLLPMGQSSTWLLSICPRALKQEIRVLGFTSNLSSTFHYLHLL